MTVIEALNILGIHRDNIGDINGIKKAFRRKAKELHPDSNNCQDSKESFEKLNEAYSILCKISKDGEDILLTKRRGAYETEIISLEQLIRIYSGEAIRGSRREISKDNISKNVYLEIKVDIRINSKRIEEKFKVIHDSKDIYAKNIDIVVEECDIGQPIEIGIGDKVVKATCVEGIKNIEFNFKYAIKVKISLWIRCNTNK